MVRVNDDHLTKRQLMDAASGSLSEAEESRIRAHTEACSECRFQLRAVVRAQELLRASKEPHLKDLSTSPPTRRNGFIVSIAFLFIVGVGALLATLTLLPRSSSTPSSEYWVPIDLVSGAFLDLEPSESELCDQALQAYARRDAQRTLELLQGTEELKAHEGEVSVFVRVLRSSALVNTGQGMAALEELQPLQIERLSRHWRVRVGWVRYLAYRDSGQHHPACEMLHWLQTEPNDLSELVAEETARTTCGNDC